MNNNDDVFLKQMKGVNPIKKNNRIKTKFSIWSILGMLNQIINSNVKLKVRDSAYTTFYIYSLKTLKLDRDIGKEMKKYKNYIEIASNL